MFSEVFFLPLKVFFPDPNCLYSSIGILDEQVSMYGFLGMSSRPWAYYIITRLVVIILAMVDSSLVGRSRLCTMLAAKQVALSVHLPFAVILLIIFCIYKALHET
ncbi:hypothetical protein CLU79DRAFT_775612 [Phycomyces nitens]|nr:hypothetical protein CLU79DRAFT_775612 [Phycomyces nitens]